MGTRNYGSAASDGIRVGSYQNSGYNSGAIGMSISPRIMYVVKPEEETFLFDPATFVAGKIPLQGDNGPAIVRTNYQGYYGVLKLDCCRALQFNIQAGTPPANIVFTISGWDFWGQKVVENVTLPSNATAAVPSIKAFSYINSIYASAGTGAANVGISTTFGIGLPYFLQSQSFLSGNFKNKLDYTVSLETGQTNVFINAPGTTANTFDIITSSVIPGDTTSPATATTGDPFGLYYLDELQVDTPGQESLVIDMYVPGFDPMKGTVLAPNISSPSRNYCFGVPQFSTGWQ